MVESRPTWGIFGGAFDPPHLGHLCVAALALATGELDRLLVVPTFDHPFGKRMAPWGERLAMTRLAFAPLARVEVSSIEETLPRPSLTLQTVAALCEAHPAVRWRLVVGSDTLGDRPSWHRFDEVERLAEPLVIGRAGHEPEPSGLVVPDVSSTALREALAAGAEVRGRLDPAVERFIRARGLYGAAARG
ncbi:MAG: nicotinate-nicotinamide nucleotide adenylyltransferase [Deltaproteobacteria bacterium]|nr:nicotinate-nicotinamide nucleotide adenylyltransferase [Deltaproteobacteria bacterium]